MLSQPKPLDKIQPNLVCELLTSMGCATAHFFSKGQISLNFNYKVSLKDFLYQTLFVFSQIKDIKNIELDFHSVIWVMPRGGTWGCFQGVKNLILPNMVMWHIKLKGMVSRTGYK